jgi:ketosteroid isomerase-like protein
MKSRTAARIKLLHVGLAALVLVFCFVASPAQSAKEKERIQRDIRTVMDRQVAAWNRGNIEGFMDGYWRSPELLFVSGDNVSRGWQTTLDRYKKGYDSRSKMGTLTFSDVEVTVISRDAAVVLGSWALERENDRPHGKFTLTFRKLKPGWRIVIDHTS